jgi:hypothetical protein
MNLLSQAKAVVLATTIALSGCGSEKADAQIQATRSAASAVSTPLPT